MYVVRVVVVCCDRNSTKETMSNIARDSFWYGYYQVGSDDHVLLSENECFRLASDYEHSWNKMEHFLSRCTGPHRLALKLSGMFAAEVIGAIVGRLTKMAVKIACETEQPPSFAMLLVYADDQEQYEWSALGQGGFDYIEHVESQITERLQDTKLREKAYDGFVGIRFQHVSILPSYMSYSVIMLESERGVAQSREEAALQN